jgi:hypothetical protein
MRLFVEPMDVVVVGVDEDGRLRYENDEAAASTPTLQERRAVIYAARRELAELAELVEILENAGTGADS